MTITDITTTRAEQISAEKPVLEGQGDLFEVRA